LNKQEGLVDWSRPARQIERQVFGMQPWPTAFTFLQRPDGDPLRVILLDVDVVESQQPQTSPGTVRAIEADAIVVQCGDGPLAIRRLQPAGKKPMNAEEFLRGYSLRPGDVFASSGE
jgi:methionyl-tRNA formyltransferase